MINIFTGLEDKTNLLNKYHEHCDVAQKLFHAEKRVSVTVRINLVRNRKRALFKTIYRQKPVVTLNLLILRRHAWIKNVLKNAGIFSLLLGCAAATKYIQTPNIFCVSLSV